jgi:hypothetical protein
MKDKNSPAKREAMALPLDCVSGLTRHLLDFIHIACSYKMFPLHRIVLGIVHSLSISDTYDVSGVNCTHVYATDTPSGVVVIVLN